MKRRILCFLESRATYGYAKNVMRVLETREALELKTLVTGMHLIPGLGNSIELISADGFPIDARVPMHADTRRASAWSAALGHAIAGYAEAIEELEPDIVLLFGDRIETFGCSVAAAYMSVPTAHVQAGDKSGHIDDAARMAMGKLCHIHLASCEDSAERLRRMGEQEFRIHNVGAPQLDDIVSADFSAGEVTVDGQTLPLDRPYLLMVQHSVLAERDEAARQIENTLEAAFRTGLPIYCIYPNSDAGYHDILESLRRNHKEGRLFTLANLERDTYLKLLANCTALIGNSSSGILEAPSFKVPVLNIGLRQRGRPQASNITNCDYPVKDISAALDLVLHDPAFREKCEAAVNPYGDGHSSARICDLLETLTLDKRLIDKETVY